MQRDPLKLSLDLDSIVVTDVLTMTETASAAGSAFVARQVSLQDWHGGASWSN